MLEKPPDVSLNVFQGFLNFPFSYIGLVNSSLASIDVSVVMFIFISNQMLLWQSEIN